ncbi:MSP domain-containing protein [Trichostrongylus colubriformis]|uniref:MSP domain-containing protein n=1 Tax=Trichostrongylus colubriformis TaxID=6319 RepID=A0AAN8FBD4_TRICO
MYWKKTGKPPEFTLVGVTMSKALPFLSVTISPDVYLIKGNSEQTVTHKIDNLSPFPIVLKIMATAPKRFSVSKNYFYLDKHEAVDIEIKLSLGKIRSHRIDVLMLPCINTLNSNWKDNPSQAFSTPYKPIVRHIRYKAPRPWSSVVEGITQHHFEVSKNIAKLCSDVGITQGSKNTISINEFAIIDEVFAQNLEKDPVKSKK